MTKWCGRVLKYRKNGWWLLAASLDSFEEASLQAINEGFMVMALLTLFSIPAAYLLEKASKKEEKGQEQD